MDIRVAPRDDLNVEEFRSVWTSLPVEFSDVNQQLSVTAAIDVGQASSQSISPAKEGLQFATRPQDRMVQAQRGGWAFNKFAPYTDWETFRREGRDLWGKYLGYINRLQIPLPLSDFKDYILTVPDVSPKLPQALTNFFMQLHIPQQDIGALLVLNVAMLPPPAEGFVSMALDIDVFRQHDVPQGEDEIWAYFERLRTKKNDVFEACITDAMRERFR